MSANAQDFDFGEYDKPGIERSRRRRGEDDALESDLEEDLLEEDWLSGKKNTSEVSDEELNDDLLQSDDEDLNMTGQDASLGMDASYDQQGSSQEADYPDDVVNLGAEGCDEEEEGGGHHQEGEVVYTEGFRQEDNTEMPEDYAGDLAEDDDGYQDEVLDIQITEPLDGEFQDEDYQSYGDEAGGGGEAPLEEDTEEVGGEKQLGEEDTNEESHVYDTEEGENDTLLEDKTKEESDEEEDDGEDSGRIRFKSERKEGVVVRLADAGQRRNIPETLELSEKAKRDLMEFEEQERQRRQTRYGGRGRGGGRGGRGRGGFPGFGMPNFRGQRRKMHDQMPPLMGNMIMQQSSRMPHPHQQQMQSHQHHPSHPRGPLPPFQEHGRPLSQQPLQPLLPPHMAHRSPPLRPQMEQPPRMMGSPPPAFPPHHQQQQQPPPPQPKNIHINPHFRGSVQSSVQVPLMPPAQSQSRPAVGPQRFPGMGEFQQHMPGNFGPPQRPPHFMEPLKTQPPQGPRDREPQFMGDRGDAARFPAQHMFDHQVPGSLNNSNSLHQQQQQQLPGQGHLGFGPPAPPFNQPNQGPLGLFQREPPRPNLPPHQGHQGMMNLNQQGGPPNQPRPFMGPRQPFGQQGNLFPPPQVQFGMQVRLRGLMHAPPVPQLPHHDTMSPLPLHQQQHHHRQDLPRQQQINLGESRPMTHHGQNLFHQQHGSPRQMTPRPQNPQQRNMSNRQRMNTPISKQMQQRNSNLRELPVAPANTNMNNTRPTPTPASQAANIRPVARATLGTRPGQNAQPTSGGGRGRGQAPNTFSQHGGAGRTVVTMETLSSPSQSEPQDPDEDEETRQYRLKIEEQKRLREEILRKKELRRQMQAGVRKKELLERLNSQTNTPNQGPAPTQTQPLQFNQHRPHPIQPQQQLQQPLLPQPPPLSEQTRPQLQAQHQRPAPQRMPQMLNYTLRHLNQDNALPPSGTAQTPAPRSNVKSRLQMVKGFTQEQQSPGVAPEQQWKDPQQQQQRNNSVQIVNRLNAPAEAVQVAQNASRTQGPGQTQGPRPAAKRTVMQRVSISGVESQQVPQKVRVVKLSGMSGAGPEATSSPVQQQSSWQASPLNQSVQRKVTMMGQQQQGPGGAPQASRGGRGNAQQSRVVVTGRGQGRGGGQMGRGHPVSVQQNLRGAETPRCTVSIEGLSTSTSEIQLKNLLKSIGPIEMFKMMPQQRKAVATFSNPQHAADFQSSFNRHMIDLSHIEVSLIDG
nr:RNA-binding protein 33 isoform X1 [Nothobranchius furzeri]